MIASGSWNSPIAAAREPDARNEERRSGGVLAVGVVPLQPLRQPVGDLFRGKDRDVLQHGIGHVERIVPLHLRNARFVDEDGHPLPHRHLVSKRVGNRIAG
jgi:hypothetical protein